ncbi:SDR family NAD(P)-dependent oxidoreductase [soil metagenome]
MAIPALSPANVAVVTGGASGIGLAAARRFAASGMRVCIADRDRDRLKEAAVELIGVASGGKRDVLTVETDVAERSSVKALHTAVRKKFGQVDILMNNAGIQIPTGITGPAADWEELLGVNLGGVINGTQEFLPAMLGQESAGLVINTGSKQGITTPPGNPAYNVSKAGVKVFTEALQHELRNMPDCLITAHLLIPGFVFTPLTANGRTDKPIGAWTPEQTVDFMLTRLWRGDFYILCPDNEVPRGVDEKRILWAARDIIENRPPLSRWHPAYAERFKNFLG